MKKSIGSILLFYSLIGCANRAEDQSVLETVGDLQKKVMEVHDEVMPKMEEIHRLKRDLVIRREQMRSVGDSTSAVLIKQIDKQLLSLQDADNAMMDWMYEFKPPSEEDEKAIEYLKSMQVSIEKVKEKMLSSIDKAKDLLNEQ